jgi:tetratricopeptide (TPR) repeat protein
VEVHCQYWTSRSGPLGGLVKIETTNVVTNRGNRMESKRTLEYTRSGSRIDLIEARSCAARGDWKAAVAAYARYFAVQPLEDGEVGFEYAAVLLLAEDQAGYRKMCAEMLAHSDQPGIRPYHVARSWTLAADAGKDTALAGQRADNELKGHGWEFWSLTEQAALGYRTGRHDAALPLLQQSLKADSRSDRVVLNWLWLALVEERRSKPAEALAWLDKATKWLERYPRMPAGPNDVTVHLHNWLEAQVLHREAKRVLTRAKKAGSEAK